MLKLPPRRVIYTLYMIACWFFVPGISGLATDRQRGEAWEACRKLGRGVNFGNALEAPRGQFWGLKLKPEYFDRVKQAGFQSVRLPVRWSDYTERSAPYEIEHEFLRQVDQWVDCAERAGLNMVLNVHHYEEMYHKPEDELPRFLAIWKQIADHYKNRSDYLYFELLNEPHDHLTASLWNDIIKQTVSIIRMSNPRRSLIVGPVHWNSISALEQLQLPDDPGLIVTVHYYEPFDFTHQGASWAPDHVRKLSNVTWQEKPEELAALQKRFDQAVDWSRKHGRPIYLGEFGAYSAAPLDSRIRWTKAVVREAERRGFSWAYWEFGAGFGIYNPSHDVWREPLLHALIPTAGVQ